MTATILAASTATASAGSSPYSLGPALRESGLISQAVFGILMLMSIMSFYILLSKLLDQQKIVNQAKRVRQDFWSSHSLRDGAAKLDKNSAYKQLVDGSLAAHEQRADLTDPVKTYDWVYRSLARSEAAIKAKLGDGLAFLATVGATAPFIGLFGTVIGIYHALIKIGATRQASVGAVAAPVGEALTMTALGLIVAVPAVLAYNWLLSRNKLIARDLSAFSSDILGYLATGGAVRPGAYDCHRDDEPVAIFRAASSWPRLDGNPSARDAQSPSRKVP